MSRTFYAFAVAIGVTLSVVASMTALKLSWDTKKLLESELGKDPYKARYRTDEQAAQEGMPGQRPVFPGKTNEQLAHRALMALCGQIQCSRLDNYVYSFSRDGTDAAGALWYRPLDPKSAEPARKHEHFICRFRNESWVICYVGSKNGPDVNMVFARSVSEAEIDRRKLDTYAPLRKRYPDE